MIATESTPAPAPGFWHRTVRGPVVAVVLATAVVACAEVTTFAIMPEISQRLDGDALYGLTISVFALLSLVGMVLGGRVVDELGVRLPFLGGLAIFFAGLLLVSVAPTMAVVVAGRALMGVGNGFFMTAAFAAQGIHVPEALRPRVLALSQSVWLPAALVAPPIGALVAARLTWRLGYIVTIVLTVLTLAVGAAVFRAQARRGGVERDRTAWHVLPLVAGLGLLLAAVSEQLIPAWGQVTNLVPLRVVLAVTGAGVAAWALIVLLPRGTFRAPRGVGSVMLVRALFGFGVLVLQAFEILAITRLLKVPLGVAALGVPAAELGLVAGAWAFSRLCGRFSTETLVRASALLVAGGAALIAAGLAARAPVWLVFAAIAVRHCGWGAGFSATAEALLAKAPAGEEGRVTSGGNVLLNVGFSVAAGAGGLVVALGEFEVGGAMAVVWTLVTGTCVAMALVLVLAGRMARGRVGA